MNNGIMEEPRIITNITVSENICIGCRGWTKNSEIKRWNDYILEEKLEWTTAEGNLPIKFELHYITSNINKIRSEYNVPPATLAAEAWLVCPVWS